MKYTSWIVILLVLAGISLMLGIESYDRSRSETAAMDGVRRELADRARLLEGDLQELAAHGRRLASELAAAVLRSRPDLLVITYGRGLSVQQAYPPRGNEGMIGLDMRLHPEFLPQFERMIQERSPVLDDTARLIHTGRAGLIFRAPILDAHGQGTAADYLGMVALTADLDDVLRRAGLVGRDRPFDLAVRNAAAPSDGAGLVGDMALFSRPHAEESIRLLGERWELAAVPRAGTLRDESHVWLIWGVGSSLVLALLLLFLYRRGVLLARGPAGATEGLMSLRTLLLVATLVPLPLIISLAGWMVFTASIQAVERLEQQRIDGLAGQLHGKAVAFFDVPRSVAQFNLGQLNDGLIDLDQREVLLRSFLLQMRQQPLLTLLVVGTPEGDYFGASRLNLGQEHGMRVLEASQADGGVLRVYPVDANDRPSRVPTLGNQHYDPRTRPWYLAAIRSGSLRWYPVYGYQLGAPGVPRDVMGMGMSVPLHDARGRILGVLAADVSLSQVSAFLQAEMMRIGGVAYLAEPGGELLATSEPEPLFHKDGDSSWRIRADDSESPMIRGLGQLVGQTGLAMGRQFLGLGARRFVAQWQTIQLPDGPRLTLAMALPESRYAEPAQFAFNRIGLIILGIWILGMATASFVAWWLSRPLLDLSVWAKRLAFGDWRASPRVRSPVREIAALAQSLERMTGTLKSQTENLEKQVSERTHDLVQANQRLLGLSMTDGLTGLANRRHFDEVLAREVARSRRDRQPVSLLMIDVDWFKSYNDQYGHPAGDEVLRRLGHILQEMMRRPGDLVARYGGEEFAVILAGLDCASARDMADRIREKVMALDMTHEHGHDNRVTVSIGVAEMDPADPRAAEKLVAQADVALYGAKAAGRNRVECASGFGPDSGA